MSDLSIVFVYGLSIFFTAQFFRALPWPALWLAEKPLSCNACMTGWSAIAHGLFVWWRMEQPPEVLPMLAAAGISYLAMGWYNSHVGQPWVPPQ